jgi:hypothetical protein
MLLQSEQKVCITMHFDEVNRSFDRTWRIGVNPILDRNRPIFDNRRNQVDLDGR